MDLSCAHVIELREIHGELLQLKVVHPHWQIHGIDRARSIRAPELEGSRQAELMSREEMEAMGMGMEVTEEQMEMEATEEMQMAERTEMEEMQMIPTRTREVAAENDYLMEDGSMDEEFPLDPFLAMDDPKKVKGKGRSFGSQNKFKSSSQNISTRRDPSGFEFVEAEFSQQVGESSTSASTSSRARRTRSRAGKRTGSRAGELAVGREKGRGRGRGRGRGSNS